MKLSSEKLVVWAANLEKLAAEFLDKTIIKQAQTQYPPELVKVLQQSLNTLHLGNLAVNGEMGTETQNALNKFYKWKNITPNPSTPFSWTVEDVKSFADESVADKQKDAKNLPTHHTRH